MSDGPGATRGGAVTVTPVGDAAALDRFIRVSAMLHAGRPGFVTPLTIERRDALRRDRNPYFNHGEAEYFLAHCGGRIVGRISAQIDRLYLERHDAATGHFGCLDATDDGAVFQALTDAASAWLSGRGMRRMLGPYSLSSNEESGLLVDGFDQPAMMMMGYAAPYAGPRLEQLGFRKAKDLLAYDYVIPDVPPPSIGRVAGRLGKDDRIRIRPVDMARYDRELAAIIAIFNDAWSENWGFIPFTPAEMAHTAKAMKPLVDRRLVWIGELAGEVAGMVVCLPNLCEAIAGLDGRLLPIGWLKLLWRLKVRGLKTGRVLLMGLRRRHHGTIIGMVLLYSLLEHLRAGMRQAGLERVELSWILEDNLPMRRVVEDLGARVYKTYRIYEKDIG